MLSLYCDLNRSNAFAVMLLAVIRFQQGRTRAIKRSWLELSNKATSTTVSVAIDGSSDDIGSAKEETKSSSNKHYEYQVRMLTL